MTHPALLLLVMLAVTGMPIKADKSPNPAAISYSGCSLKQPLNCNSHSDSDIQMGECWSNSRVMQQKSAFFVPFKPGEKSYHSEGGPYGTCTAYACFPSESDMQEESNLSNFCFFWDGKDHTVIPNGGLSRRGLFERDGTASDDGDPNTSQNMTKTTDPTTTDPTTADPTTTDPTTTDPTTTDPTTADPTTADPTTADPTTADPTTADPTTADPTTTDPTTTDPTAVDPNTGTAPDPTTGNNATSTGTGTSSGTKGKNKYKHKKMKKTKKPKKPKKPKTTKKPKKPKTIKTKTKKKEKSPSSTGGSSSSSQSSNSSMPNAPGKVVIPIPMICPSNLANCYSANYFEKGGKLEVYANLIPTYTGLWFPPKNKNHEFMFCKGLGLGCPTPTMRNLQLQHIGDQHCDTSKCKVPPNSN
jgi:hypothetical protein